MKSLAALCGLQPRATADRRSRAWLRSGGARVLMNREKRTRPGARCPGRGRKIKLSPHRMCIRMGSEPPVCPLGKSNSSGDREGWTDGNGRRGEVVRRSRGPKAKTDSWDITLHNPKPDGRCSVWGRMFTHYPQQTTQTLGVN